MFETILKTRAMVLERQVATHNREDKEDYLRVLFSFIEVKWILDMFEKYEKSK